MTERSEMENILKTRAIDSGIKGGVQGEGKTAFSDKAAMLSFQKENFVLKPNPVTIFLAISANLAPSEKVR